MADKTITVTDKEADALILMSEFVSDNQGHFRTWCEGRDSEMPSDEMFDDIDERLRI